MLECLETSTVRRMPKILKPKTLPVIPVISSRKKVTHRRFTKGKSKRVSLKVSEGRPSVQVEEINDIEPPIISNEYSEFDDNAQFEPLLSDVTIYELEIIKAGGVQTVFDDNSVIILPDFDVEKKILNMSKIVLVSRFEVRIINKNHIISCIYGCSCNPTQNEFVKNLGAVLMDDLDNLNECIHIKLYGHLVPFLHKEIQDMDNSEDNEGNQENDQEKESEVGSYAKTSTFLHELSFDTTRLVVCVEGDISVVGHELYNLKCYMCGGMTCKHCRHVLDFDHFDPETPSIVIELFDQQRRIKVKKPSKAVSTEAINFDLCTEMKHLMKKRPSDYLPTCSNDSETLELHDETGKYCMCGGKFQIKPHHGDSVKLFTKDEIYNVLVFSLICDSCFIEKQYDGGEHAILNMGTFCMHHLVFRDYLHHFLNGNSMTLFGYYKVWINNQDDLGNNLKDYMNYDNWRIGWYGYLRLLDIDYSNGFNCELCGTCPDIIVCDATSLGFQKKFARVAFPKRRNDEINEIIPRKSTHDKRIAIKKRSVQVLLKKWCNKKLHPDQNYTLSSQLSDYPEIHEAFLWVSKTFSSNIPSGILYLFRCLACPSPVCSYVHPSKEHFDLLTKLFDRNIKCNAFVMKELHLKLPIFYKVLVDLRDQQFPLEMKGLIFKLIELSKQPFCCSKVAEEPPEHGNKMAQFPSLPLVRRRQVFQMDKQKDDALCTKIFTRHKRLTAGIFTIYCIHGINYGFECLETAESSNIPFTIFRTRFPKAPSTIIYDNCCNLHTYCLNRDPIFFQKTKFVVDRFHWYNHSGCAPSYDIRIYPSMHRVNSQINEQQNAATKKLKTQLSFMSPDNFMKHCTLFLWYRNLLKKRNLQRTILSVV